MIIRVASVYIQKAIPYYLSPDFDINNGLKFMLEKNNVEEKVGRRKSRSMRGQRKKE